MSMRTIVTISACVIALTFANAHARMYQWSHPASGIVQLSGAPPAWYRSTAQGPRVLVFDNGRLIDDTAVVVGEPLRESLRAAAFPDAGVPSAVAASTPKPREPEREMPARANDTPLEMQATAEPMTSGQESATPPEGTVEQTVAELKSLLDAWDSRRRDEARSLLLNNDARTGGSSP
jgi:hypothetical protein